MSNPETVCLLWRVYPVSPRKLIGIFANSKLAYDSLVISFNNDLYPIVRRGNEVDIMAGKDVLQTYQMESTLVHQVVEKL